MKIVFDCERMKYPYTGLFEYCYQLSLALFKEVTSPDELKLYMQSKDLGYYNNEVSIINQKSIDKFIFPKIDPSIDIWHTTHQLSWYIPPTNRKVKRVLTIHDLNFLYEEKSESKRKNYLKRHQKNVNEADHIIAISEFTKQDILKHLKISKPVTVIYNGCNIQAFPNFNAPKYRPKEKFLFSLGTVNEKKNFHVLIGLLEENDFELVISGKEDPSYVAKIKAEAKTLKVEDRIHLTGLISNEDKYWYLKNCTAFLLPSLAEGFGIPVIEAMSFGKPIFLSTATCLPEIGGTLAYYFPSFEKELMKSVLKAGLEHYNLTNPSENIIKHALQFNWQASAKSYLEVYRNLMLSD